MRYHLLRRAVLVSVVVVVGLSGTAGIAHAQNPPEEIEYYATDALGSVRIVFDRYGNVLGRSDYLPFGETLNQSGALPRQRFTGQERDGEAGLDYFNARSLQARTGRMNAPDPLFGDPLYDPQQWNRYAYVRNQPLTLVDPTGLESVFRTETVAFLDSFSPTIKTTNLISYSTSFPLGEGGDMAGAESSESAVVGGGGDDGQQAVQVQSPPAPPGAKPELTVPASIPSRPLQQKIDSYARKGLSEVYIKTHTVKPVEWACLVCGSRDGMVLRLTPSAPGIESFAPEMRCRAGETMWADIHSHLHPGASLGFSRDSTHSIQNDIDNMAWFPTVSFYVADALGNFHKSLNGNITAFGQSPFLFK